MAKAANEIGQIELLLRDVKIQFDELRRERDLNDALRKENDLLRSQNDKLQEDIEQLRERLANDEQEEKDELAFYIANQREARKLSLNGFARLLDTTSTTISNYEKGKGKLKAMQELVGKIQRLKGAK